MNVWVTTWTFVILLNDCGMPHFHASLKLYMREMLENGLKGNCNNSSNCFLVTHIQQKSNLGIYMLTCYLDNPSNYLQKRNPSNYLQSSNWFFFLPSLTSSYLSSLKVFFFRANCYSCCYIITYSKWNRSQIRGNYVSILFTWMEF